jgi:16S rRNA processing protein RimM
MRLVVGRLGRAHGIRGELTVEVRTDEPEERFAPGSVLLCEGRVGVPDTVTVRTARWQNGRLILGLDGVEDRTAAEVLRGVVLEADIDPAAGENDEFHDQVLVGLDVRDEQGLVLGSITEVLHLPGQDLLAVQRPSAPELLVPFVTEIVPLVDVSGGFVVVDLPEGLDELGSSSSDGSPASGSD